jgi:hypothetical protein
MAIVRQLQIETDQVRIVVAQRVLAADVRAHGFEVAHGAATFAYVGRTTVPCLCVNVAFAAPHLRAVAYFFSENRSE